MKLYDSEPAPNPRRVRIFLAEKGIPFGTSATDSEAVQLVPVDMAAGEHRSEAARARNPLGQIPVLELDDGTAISESVAICRYFEALRPDPPLFGSGLLEQARVEMWNRRIELGLLSQVGIAWRNGPVVAKMAPGRFRRIPEAKEDAEQAARSFYRRMNGWLADQGFLNGDAFSIADITALCTIDFASALVDLAPDPELTELQRWHEEVSARPAASA
jgi:glutathione S-transferase